ncbi:MAG: DUF5069 domain-containing protein [Opitutales bacterium]|nr:DUF5069 domain-containing protein [Opitutales bacterium]
MDYRVKYAGTEDGPTGGIATDLPSPYLPYSNGLLHLPRFIAKIRKSLAGELPKSYRRNFKKGFDRFLCLHLGVEPEEIEEIVKAHQSDEAIEKALQEKLPEDLKVSVWNRKVCQMGMSEMGREKIAELKEDMGVADREDLMSFADLIDYDEGRIE